MAANRRFCSGHRCDASLRARSYGQFKACLHSAKCPISAALAGSGDQSGALEFASAKDAADYLEKTQGNILLTTGSREIEVFAPLNREKKRVFARVLPAEESIAACRRAGVSGRNLLCMQGPFSADFTDATLREFGCRFLVTKNSGGAGGFAEKMEAARRAGAQVLVIRRPEEDGLSLTQVQEYLVEWTGKKVGKDV